jgi:hypothetical protein
MRFDDERFDAGALGRREVYIFDVSPTANYPLRVKMACTRLPLLASECGHSLCTRQIQAAKPEPLSDLRIAKAQVNLLSRERDELRGMVAKLEFAAAGWVEQYFLFDRGFELRLLGKRGKSVATSLHHRLGLAIRGRDRASCLLKSSSFRI